MADYIYLIENRLSPGQRKALLAVREVAKFKGLTIFLVGGAVRDLTSGSPVRDLDVVVQGNALKIKKEIEKAGGLVAGETEQGQALHLRFAGGVRMEVASMLAATYPKPGKPVYKPGTIQEDLKRRDFTSNAMALSLNEGSYGLLIDPLNGVADIENRELRLVSNYGFIEEPVRMVRAARLMARLGWQMEEKTAARYETGKAEGYIDSLAEHHRGYEAEEIVHEEDALRVMRRLEAEGWMKHLAPAWSSAKVNVVELEKVREAQTQLQMQGIQPDAAAANFSLLTAKMSSKEVAALKKSFPRQGFVAEIDALEGETKAFAAQLGGKGATSASQAWKLLTTGKPEAVLMVAYGSKSPSIQAKFKSFYTEWPQARQKLPYTMMQEMRIVPELAGYNELLESLFFELMDGKLTTPEEMKAYLEPHSPPAPPPPVHLRRPRAAKKESKVKVSRSKKAKAGSETDGNGGNEESTSGADAGTSQSADVKGVRTDAVKSGKDAGAKSVAAVAAGVATKPPTGNTAPAKGLSNAPGKPTAKAAGAPVKASPKGAPVKATSKALVQASTKVAPAKGSAKSATAFKAPVKAVPTGVRAVKKASAGGAEKKLSGKIAGKPAEKKIAPPAKKVAALARKTTDKGAAKKVMSKAGAKKAPGKLVKRSPAKAVVAKSHKKAAELKIPVKASVKSVKKTAKKGR